MAVWPWDAGLRLDQPCSLPFGPYPIQQLVAGKTVREMCSQRLPVPHNFLSCAPCGWMTHSHPDCPECRWCGFSAVWLFGGVACRRCGSPAVWLAGGVACQSWRFPPCRLLPCCFTPVTLPPFRFPPCRLRLWLTLTSSDVGRLVCCPNKQAVQAVCNQSRIPLHRKGEFATGLSLSPWRRMIPAGSGCGW